MVRIELFTKYNCPKCWHVKSMMMDAHKISTIELPVIGQAHMEYLQSKGVTTVPAMFIYNDQNEEMIITAGFTKENLSKKFREHTGGELFE